MAQFNTGVDLTRTGGICDQIKQSPTVTDEVRDLVRSTEQDGTEYATAYVLHDGQFYHKNTIQGNEKRITSKGVNNLLVQLPSDIDFRVNIHRDDELAIHTHPGGFPELSLQDLVAFIDLQDRPQNLDHLFVATDAEQSEVATNDSVVLNGVSVQDSLEQQDVQDLKSVSQTVQTLVERNRIQRYEAMNRIWDEMGPNFETCSTTF